MKTIVFASYKLSRKYHRNASVPPRLKMDQIAQYRRIVSTSTVAQWFS